MLDRKASVGSGLHNHPVMFWGKAHSTNEKMETNWMNLSLLKMTILTKNREYPAMDKSPMQWEK